MLKLTEQDFKATIIKMLQQLWTLLKPVTGKPQQILEDLKKNQGSYGTEKYNK